MRASVRGVAQITIHCVGKRRGSSSSEAWAESAYAEYAKRLAGSQVSLSTAWHKSDEDLTQAVQREEEKGRGSVVCLDERGQLLSSTAFASLVGAQIVEGGSRLAFVIGGADGLPPALRGEGRYFLSLSTMTFTHQMARVVLAEQLYRGRMSRRTGRARSGPSCVVQLSRASGCRSIPWYCGQPTRFKPEATTTGDVRRQNDHPRPSAPGAHNAARSPWNVATFARRYGFPSMT